MSGVSANCYASKWHHRRGSNRNDVDDLAKQRDLIRLCLNDREGDLAHIPCLIRLCPNGHAVALVRSLEHVHRLVGFYQGNHVMKKTIVSLVIIGTFIIYSIIHAQSDLAVLVQNPSVESHSSSNSGTSPS